MSKIKDFLGDKKWLSEPNRPDDTDWRQAIELLEQTDAENERFIDLMKGATLDYGYANGWGKDPVLIKECKEKNHKRNDRSLGHFDNIVWCEICGYQYRYDSS